MNGFFDFFALSNTHSPEKKALNGFRRNDVVGDNDKEAKEGFVFVSFAILYSDSFLDHQLRRLVVSLRDLSDFHR